MANSSRGVSVVAKLLGGRKIETEAKEIGRSIEGVGKDAKKADDEAGKASKGWALFSSRQKKAGDDAKKTHNVLKSVVGAAAGLASGYIGFSTVTSAIEKVKESAQEINKLQAMGVGGSDTQTLQIISAFKARGVGAETLGKSMKKLATSTQTAERQEHTWASGRAKAAAKEEAFTTQLGTSATAFKELGIEVQAFKKLAPEQQFEMIAKKLTALPAGMDKTRIATQLLGRGATALLPVLTKGALGWEAQLKAAKEFLPHLSGGKRGFEELEVQESRSKMASEGLKLSLGVALLPVVTKVMGAVTKLAYNVEHGVGAWGKLGRALGVAGGFLKGVYGWLNHTHVGSYVLVGALGALLVAWTALKVIQGVKSLLVVWNAATKIAGVTTAFFGDACIGTRIGLAALAVQEKASAAATWLMNAALDANPIGLVIIALAALAAGFYLAYTKIKWFRTEIGNAWSWIKGHWPLLAQILLTPILGPVVLIIFHWKLLVSFFKKVPNELAAAGKGMWDWIKEGFRSVIDWVLKGWNSLHFKVPGIKTPFGSVGGFNIGMPHIPLLAEGGTVRTGGAAIIGERGPELLSLPAGARVDPLLPEGRTGGNQPGTWRSADGNLIVICQIDRREVGRAVVTDFGSVEARRG